MTGWWRANAVALGAILVLVPATYAAMTWNEWSAVVQNTATQPVTVEPGDAIEFAGATIGPVSAEFTQLPDMPQGTRVVTVTLHVDPGDPPLRCAIPTLHEIGGLERQWSSRDDLGREWNPDTTVLCSEEATAPYDLLLDYLVADDVPGPFTVELIAASALPEFVSAVVEP